MRTVRRYTDRKHLPDRRVSFGGVPVSFDVKTTIFVEANSHNEYFLLSHSEPVAIIYKDGEVVCADWKENLTWSGPFPPSPNSTSGDSYYRISGGRPLSKWLLSREARERILRISSIVSE